MNEPYSSGEVEKYLSKVNSDLDLGAMDSVTFHNDFSFHQARILGIECDLLKEILAIDVACVDWLKENTGVSNPYLPNRLVFRDMVQFYYKNREVRKEPKIFDLKAMTVSEYLIEAKDLYSHRVEGGGKPISLDIQMPLEDSEVIILCSEFDVHVGERMITVGP
jgi:hypothetical protein